MKRCGWCESALPMELKKHEAEGARKFCSATCRQRARDARRRVYEPRERHCFLCGKTFLQKPGRGRPPISCSAPCKKRRHEWMKAQYSEPSPVEARAMRKEAA